MSALINSNRISRIFKPLSFFLLISAGALAQTEELVCIPCGHPCDSAVVKSGTECQTCRMLLVPKSTVKFTNLSPKEFCARITANPDAVVIDVRSEQEFKGTSGSVRSFGHFKKAINVNVNQLGKNLDELNRHKNQEVLLYCSHSHRSPRAAYYLGMQGFTNVVNMTGGVSKLDEALKSACFKEQFIVHPK